MVLGKKFDPMSDENYKQLVTLENKAKTAEKKVADIATEISDIDNGHLDKYLHQGAFKSLQKRVNGLNEELQKMLESLDGFQLNEDQLGKWPHSFQFFVCVGKIQRKMFQRPKLRERV